ncbi:glycine cleavage system aminomethyltransferase GcvT [bacterium]|nr:glycine cleavage system aminomethyltransferase GcvT [bacterium]MBU1025315.1 glycine cleavage system aminomethyltransferase GcvT [bacterium]
MPLEEHSLNTAGIRRTPLYDEHVKLGGRIVEFAGYELPVWYTSQIEEHKFTRESCGVFDLTHMGEAIFEGPKALDTIDKLLSNNPRKLEVGQAQYTLLMNDKGGIVDDLIVYRLDDEVYLWVFNGANVEKDTGWIRSKVADETIWRHRSYQTSLIAVQGPKSEAIVERVFPDAGAKDLDYFGLKWLWREDEKWLTIARTGYTGEDGFEIIVSNNFAVEIWRKLFKYGGEDIKPIGLAARDTLRMEKAYALYGNDIDEDSNPFEANLGWVVKLKNREFSSSEILQNLKKEGVIRKLSGLKPAGRAAARHGDEIFADGKKVGIITSGSFAPTVGDNIALGYILKEYAEIDNIVQIEVRNKRIDAKVVNTPFIEPRTK